VVVNQDERHCVRENRALEDLSGVNEACCRGAHGDLLQAEHLVASVQEEGEKALSIPSRQLLTE
jgi:hypothetical protein